jgi:SAM-dependent methyltransferase
MKAPYRFWIDSPSAGEVVTPYVMVAGWIATGPEVGFSDLHLHWDGSAMSLESVERLDVANTLTAESARRRRGLRRSSSPWADDDWSDGLAVHGFQGLWTLDEVPRSAEAEVRFVLDGVSQQIDITIRRDAAAVAHMDAAKARKAQALEGILQCPSCRSTLTRGDATCLSCDSCGERFSVTNGVFDFLPSSFRERHRIRDTSRVSAWAYDAKASELVERFSEGLILDCGSGLRPSYLPNVVNFEVVDYPTTDVLGVGQALPFVDDCFDAVFSFAVLEHVTDPFACAAEIARVLKPGGVLFAVVPFLQPFHGYPDHYYNMTASGLQNLFRPHLDVYESGIPEQGLPIYSLTWILNSYLAGLDPQTAAGFAELKVKDLVGNAADYLQRDIVRNLSPAANEELAATSYVMAVKRPVD